MALSTPTLPVLVSLTGNDIIVVIETTDSVQDFYALFLQLEESDREVVEAWSVIGPELRVPVDSNDQSEFKIQDILKKEFTDHITDPLTDLFEIREGYVRKYRFKYYERYGSDQTKYLEATSGSYYATQGGIGHLTENKYEDLSSSWWAQLQAQKFFLTDMPKDKVTNLVLGNLYREKLFFYNYSSQLAFSLSADIKIYFTDKTPQLDQIQLTAAVQHEIYELEASYVKLGITDPNAYAYEIWISQIGSPLTKKQSFIIDRDFYRRSKYFIYNNKYQLTESLLFTGEYEEQAKYTKLESISLESQEYSEFDITEEIPRKASTGFIKREWLQHLREFYLALKKYEIVNYKLDDTYNLVPITFDSKKIPLPDSEETLFNHVIKYIFAFTSNFNDNVLFINPILTAPTEDTFDLPLNGATGVVKNTSAIITINGICYPGDGAVKLQKVSDLSIAQTIAAKDCIFERDPSKDETQLSFLIYDTEISTEYEVVIDAEAVLNADGLNYKQAAQWRFTMGTNSLEAEFTAVTSDADPDNPSLSITRPGMLSNDLRNTKTNVKLLAYEGHTDKNINYTGDPWTDILIDNDIADLYNYYAAEITVTDYYLGTELSSIQENIYLYFTSVSFTNVNNIVFTVFFDLESTFLLNKDGDIQEINVPASTNYQIDLSGFPYSSVILFAGDIKDLKNLEIDTGPAEIVTLSKNIKIDLVDLTNSPSGTINNIFIANNATLNRISAGAHAISNDLFKLDLTGTDNIDYLSVYRTEIGLNGNNYQLLDLSNKALLSSFVRISSNNFTQAMVDFLLDELDQSGAIAGSPGDITIVNNAIPSAAGLVSKANLEAKGWGVDVDS